MPNEELTDPITVAQLRCLLDRHKKALCEAGRPDLAELAQVGIDASRVFLTFPAPVPQYGPQSAAVLKALEIDPDFESAGPPAHETTGAP